MAQRFLTPTPKPPHTVSQSVRHTVSHTVRIELQLDLHSTAAAETLTLARYRRGHRHWCQKIGNVSGVCGHRLGRLPSVGQPVRIPTKVSCQSIHRLVIGNQGELASNCLLKLLPANAKDNPERSNEKYIPIYLNSGQYT